MGIRNLRKGERERERIKKEKNQHHESPWLQQGSEFCLLQRERKRKGGRKGEKGEKEEKGREERREREGGKKREGGR